MAVTYSLLPETGLDRVGLEDDSGALMISDPVTGDAVGYGSRTTGPDAVWANVGGINTMAQLEIDLLSNGIPVLFLDTPNNRIQIA